MADRKVFSILEDDTDDLAPIPFRLEGRLRVPVAPDGVDLPAEVVGQLEMWDSLPKRERKALVAEHQLVTTWSMDLEAVPVAPAGALDDLTRSIVVDERTGKPKWNAFSLNRFMEGVLLDRHVARFTSLVHDKNRLLPIEALGEVVTWLSQETTTRPTRPSSD